MSDCFIRHYVPWNDEAVTSIAYTNGKKKILSSQISLVGFVRMFSNKFKPRWSVNFEKTYVLKMKNWKQHF